MPMSRYPDNRPDTKGSELPVVDAVIVPRAKDLGGFSVRRALPAAERRSIGAFVFLDHLGPAAFPAGSGIDVRPHPHIGLATVTYLFEGRIIHRDSLGSVQAIVPGDVNWMTAGRGIVHSERSDDSDRLRARTMHGLQLWVALPRDYEEMAPGFAHYEAAALPVAEFGGATIRVIAGAAFGLRSPVNALSELFFADVTLPAGRPLVLDADYDERAVYIVEGEIAIRNTVFPAGRLVAFHPGSRAVITAATESRLAFLGGAPLDGPRHLWWNFVSSSKDRIEQAKADWARDRFGLSVPGDDEFIPLPG
jgi:redox-sensitive bicupin YhaK (pirin superfamily)